MDTLGISFVDVDVNEALKEDRRQKKEKKKQLKKEKKEHKQKKKAKKYDSPSSGSEDQEGGSDGEYNGDGEIAKEAGLQRDDWMTAQNASDRNILTGQMGGHKADDAKAKADEAPQLPKARELNPDRAQSQVAAPKSTPLARSGVGDGGASWRLKALRRAQNLAEEEGKDVNEIVSERFGSLSHLTSQVTNERAAHAHAHLHAQRDRARQREGQEKPEYLQDVGSQKPAMRRPDPHSSFSWRKKTDHRSDKDFDHRAHRDKGDKARKEAQPEGRREGRPSEGERRRDSTEHRPAERDNWRNSRDHHRQERPRHRQDDADLLQKVAKKMNAFPSDGSFFRNAKAEDSADILEREHQSGEAERDRHQSGAIDQSKQSDLRHREESGSRPTTVVGANPNRESQGVIKEASEGVDGDNRSAAAKLRARLMGKTAPAVPTSNPVGNSKNKVSVLPSVDAEGRAMPGAFGRDSAGHGQIDGGRKVKKLQRFEDGEKQQYFRDDNRSLDELVREQRYNADDNIDANLAENIARKSKFRERDLDVDDEYDVDGGLDMYESRNKKVTQEKAAKRQRTAQISDARRHDNALSKCNLCFGSQRFANHLLVAVGQVAYLSLPERGRLHPQHCCIVPTEHIASTRKTDEHVWTEMRNFKKCIIQMNAKEGLNTMFWEVAMRLEDSRSHAIVHAVPVNDSAFHKAPVVFKKSLDEAESEWSQHHAKAVIETRTKGLRGSVPANFPYFFVEFGLSNGYVHVIDNEEKFDKDFGRSIMAGLLKLGAEHQKRGAKAESQFVQEKLVKEFKLMFDPFDWTKQLED